MRAELTETWKQKQEWVSEGLPPPATSSTRTTTPEGGVLRGLQLVNTAAHTLIKQVKS